MTCKIAVLTPCDWGRLVRLCGCDYPCGSDSAGRAQVMLADPVVIDGLSVAIPDRFAYLNLCRTHMALVKRGMDRYPGRAIFQFILTDSDDIDDNHVDAHSLGLYNDAT